MTRPALFKGKLSLFAISIAIFSFFISCSNLVSDNFENQSSASSGKSESLVYFTGVIDASLQQSSSSFEKIALPKPQKTENSTRTAIPDFINSSTLSSQYEYFVSAQTADGSLSAEGSVDASLNYSIGLKAGYKWEVTAGIRNTDTRQIIMSDSYEVTINAETAASTKNMILKPATSGSGSVSLTLSVDSSIKKVSVELAGASYNFEVSGDSASIDIPSVAAGAHNATISFLDDSSPALVLYSIKQIINVFAGVSTNTWVIGGSSKTSLNISSSEIESQKRTIFYVAEGKVHEGDKFHEAAEGNDGSAYYPLPSITSALQKIAANAKDDADYFIYVTGTIQDNAAIATSAMKSLTIQNVSGSTATIDGDTDGDGTGNGSVFTVDTSKPVKFKGVTIKNGSATSMYSGGGIYQKSGSIYIEDCNFISNTAYNGGALYCQGTVYIYGSTVFGDSSIRECPTVITDGINNATNAGGAIYMVGDTLYLGYSGAGTPASFTGGIYGNAANYGGGIYTDGTANVVMADGCLAYNYGKSNGGGIRQGTTGKLTITGGSLIENKVEVGISADVSGGDGGAIYIGNGSIFEMGGKISIPCDNVDINDIFLVDGTTITVNTSFNNDAPVATITPQVYSYGVTTVLSGTEVSSQYSKFALSDDSYGVSWVINNQGKIIVPSIDLKTGTTINTIFGALGAKTSATLFEQSSTAPSAGTTINYLDTSESLVQVWYDSENTSLKYFITLDGYEEDGGKLLLNQASDKMFEGCSAITELNLSSFDFSKVTSTESMFRSCSALTTICVRYDIDLSAVTSSSNMFDGCSVLSGTFGTVYNASNPSDKTYARVDGGEDSPGYFTSTKHIKTGSEINILFSQLGYVTNKSFERSSSAPSGISASEIQYLDYGEENYPMWAADNKIYYYTGIEEKLTMNPDASKMFESCIGFTSIDLSGFDFSKVTNMDSTFKSLTHITSLDLSGLDTSKVKSMQSTFYGCSSLRELTLNIDTSSLESLSTTFAECSSLTEIDLSSCDLSKVTNMNQTFFKDTALTTIYVKTGTTMNPSLTGAGTFTNCTSLKGGAGTAYTDSNNDYTYARIDGGTANPGYFTAK